MSSPPTARCHLPRRPGSPRRRAAFSPAAVSRWELIAGFAVSIILLIILCCIMMTGCAATQARQSITAAADGPPVPAVQQSGQGNITAQLDAGGWKGIEYSSAVPVGQVVLMGLMLLFSHRREMARIRQSGGHTIPVKKDITT